MRSADFACPRSRHDVLFHEWWQGKVRAARGASLAYTALDGADMMIRSTDGSEYWVRIGAVSLTEWCRWTERWGTGIVWEYGDFVYLETPDQT